MERREGQGEVLRDVEHVGAQAGAAAEDPDAGVAAGKQGVGYHGPGVVAAFVVQAPGEVGPGVGAGVVEQAEVGVGRPGPGGLGYIKLGPGQIAVGGAVVEVREHKRYFDYPIFSGQPFPTPLDYFGKAR